MLKLSSIWKLPSRLAGIIQSIHTGSAGNLQNWRNKTLDQGSPRKEADTLLYTGYEAGYKSASAELQQLKEENERLNLWKDLMKSVIECMKEGYSVEEIKEAMCIPLVDNWEPKQ